jgi:hypothetical protein
MSPQPDERITALERRIAELEASSVRLPTRRTASVARRLALLVLAIALTVPAGVVLASHTFSDVPSTNKFHSDIAAIAAAGITSGCAPDRYCPDGLVTRGQMAAFLNRLGALAPGKAPKVNADRVDGLHANALIRVGQSQTTADTVVTSTGTLIAYGTDLVIDAPAPGFVMVDASAVVVNSGCTSVCTVTLYAHHVQGDTYSIGGNAGLFTNGLDTVVAQRVFPVSSGTNTFRMVVRRAAGGNGTVTATSGVLTALYTPFGASGTGSLNTLALEEQFQEVVPGD